MKHRGENLLGFAVAAAYWPGLLSAPYVPRWAVIAVGLPLVSRCDPREIGGAPGGVLLLLIGFGALSLMASPDPMGGALELWFIVLLSLVFVAGAGMENLDGVMTGAAWGLCLSSIVVVIQALGWNPLYTMSARPSGLFGNSEVVAEFAAIIFVWAVTRPRYLLAGIAFVPVLLCGSRLAWLVTGLGLLYAWWPLSWKLRGLSTLVIASAGALSLIWLGDAKFISGAHRIILWIATALAIDPIQAPLGMGLGWFQAAHPSENFAHSDVLQALAEIGPVAALLILIPLFAFARNRGNHAERAAFVVVCAEALVSFPLHFPASGFVVALLAGHLARARTSLRRHEPYGRVEDGCRLQWAITTRCPDPGRSGWRGRVVPLRPLPSPREAVCATAGE